MTVRDLEQQIEQIDKTQQVHSQKIEKIENRQDQFESSINTIANSLQQIHTIIAEFRQDQTHGWGKTKGIIDSLSSSSVGIAMLIFIIIYMNVPWGVS